MVVQPHERGGRNGATRDIRKESRHVVYLSVREILHAEGALPTRLRSDARRISCRMSRMTHGTKKRLEEGACVPSSVARGASASTYALSPRCSTCRGLVGKLLMEHNMRVTEGTRFTAPRDSLTFRMRPRR
eukprot:scaffold263_cov251-Pinguiococcus_pyrenoidosus.AAC.6